MTNMNYPLDVNKRKPVELMPLDDTPTFTSVSPPVAEGGSLFAGTTARKHASLINGLSSSAVFSSALSGRFYTDIFPVGSEAKSFSIEAWAKSIDGSDVAYESTLLQPNPSYTGLSTGWTATDGSTIGISTQDFLGEDIPVLESISEGSAQNYAPEITVDPNKAYRIRFWYRDTAIITGNQFYFGLYAYDSTNVQVGMQTVTAATGEVNNASNTNPYFFYISTPTVGVWRYAETYIFPVGSTTNDMLGQGYFASETLSNNNMMFNANVAKIRLRWLNWANTTGNPRTVHVADWQVAEVEKIDDMAWEPVAGHAAEQLVLGHATPGLSFNRFSRDGLTINGNAVSFATRYANTGEARARYELQAGQKVHLVGVHTPNKNSLYVNGALVDEVDITDAQQADAYIQNTDDTNLWSGLSDSSARLVVGGIGLYNYALSSDSVLQNYNAGISRYSDSYVTDSHGGISMKFDVDAGTTFTELVWDTNTFDAGSFNNTVEDSGRIQPILINDVPQPGSWTNAFPLDATGVVSIYGVSIDWTGKEVIIETSLDGNTWTAAEKRVLIPNIANGFDPTGQELLVRARFDGTVADAYVERISVIGWHTNAIPVYENRTVTLTHPAVLRGDGEVTEYRDDVGVFLNGGGISIGADTSPDPVQPQTIELWMKVHSGTPTINQAGTTYINGQAGTTMPTGEWFLYHIVTAAAVIGDITISGDVSISHVGLYEDAKSAADITNIYNAFVGINTTRVTDSATLNITGAIDPVKIYANDWSITGAG